MRGWDFLFYASFGVVVTSSVRIAGVLLVFSYLIVPALAGILLGGSVAHAPPRSAGASAPLVSVLAMLASASLDLPTGATVVCAFGLTPARARRHRRRSRAGRGHLRGRRARAARGGAGDARASPRPAGAGRSLSPPASRRRRRPAKPLVVATFYPLYEFSRQVAGDRAEVVSLVPPGVEPHDWEPSPQNVVQVQKARLFVYNGAGFEPWVDKLLQDVAGQRQHRDRRRDAGHLPLAAPPGASRRTRTSGSIPCSPRRRSTPSAPGSSRPIPRTRRAYADNAPPLQGAARARSTQAFAAGLRDCARRDIVTSHTAFAYLARRYRLDAGAGHGPRAGVGAEPRRAGRDRRPRARAGTRRYIFFETLVSSRLAETLAREIGAKTLVLNPVEGLTKEEAAAGKDYVALMEAESREPAHGARSAGSSVCFVTCLAWPDISESDGHVARALEARGVAVTRACPGIEPDARFDGFDAVIFRSSWDYHHAPDAYLAWLARWEAAGVRFWNPPALIRWNLTQALPARPRARRRADHSHRRPRRTRPRSTCPPLLAERGWSTAVVKPVLGASAHDAVARGTRRRAAPSRPPSTTGGFGGPCWCSRSSRRSRTRGEWSLVFIDGALTHAVVKRPASGDFRVQAHYGGTSARAQRVAALERGRPARPRSPARRAPLRAGRRGRDRRRLPRDGGRGPRAGALLHRGAGGRRGLRRGDHPPSREARQLGGRAARAEPSSTMRARRSRRITREKRRRRCAIPTRSRDTLTAARAATTPRAGASPASSPSAHSSAWAWPPSSWASSPAISACATSSCSRTAPRFARSRDGSTSRAPGACCCPRRLVIFALSPHGAPRWWLWAGVFLGSGALEHAVKFLVDRPRPSGFAVWASRAGTRRRRRSSR